MIRHRDAVPIASDAEDASAVSALEYLWHVVVLVYGKGGEGWRGETGFGPGWGERSG